MKSWVILGWFPLLTMRYHESSEGKEWGGCNLPGLAAVWPAVIRRHCQSFWKPFWRRGGKGQAPTADAGEELEDFPREIMGFQKEIGRTTSKGQWRSFLTFTILEIQKILNTWNMWRYQSEIYLVQKESQHKGIDLTIKNSGLHRYPVAMSWWSAKKILVSFANAMGICY